MRDRKEHNLVRIDAKSGVPLYRQIIDQILIAISGGQLTSGDRLPTVRQLAIDTQVNPNTVARAYRELELRGVTRTQRGTGTFVASGPDAARDEALQRVRIEKYCDAIIAEAGRMGISLSDLERAFQDRLVERR